MDEFEMLEEIVAEEGNETVTEKVEIVTREDGGLAYLDHETPVDPCASDKQEGYGSW